MLQTWCLTGDFGPGRAITKYAWKQVGSAGDVVINAAVDAANSANGGTGAPQLTIPGTMLSKIPAGAYTISLTVTNRMGASNSNTFSFSKVAAGVAPVVTIAGGLSSYSFKWSEGISLTTQLLASSVCSNSKVEWSWRVYDWPEFNASFPQGYTKKDLVVPGPIAPTATYPKASVAARFASRTEATVLNITLYGQASELRPVLRGPSGSVRMDRTIVLNATSSMDPDDPANSITPFSIAWDCRRSDWPTPCYTGRPFGSQQELSWSFEGSNLAAGVEYTFTATLSKHGRYGSYPASLKLTPTSDPVPTGRIVRVCAAHVCPTIHTSVDPLPLSIVADAGSEGAVVSWSSDQVPSISSFNGHLDINIPADQLPSSGAVTVTATLTKGGLSSKTIITVPINGKPTCNRLLCLAVTATSSVFPAARFSAMPTGFVDDDAEGSLRYGIGSCGSSQRLTAADSFLCVGPSTTAYTGSL